MHTIIAPRNRTGRVILIESERQRDFEIPSSPCDTRSHFFQRRQTYTYEEKISLNDNLSPLRDSRLQEVLLCLLAVAIATIMSAVYVAVLIGSAAIG
jgi:hypothetical protein